jgi:hypothetical protein
LLVSRAPAVSPLPAQSAESVALHQAVLEHFEKRHKLKQNPKMNFMMKKEKHKKARELKRAEDLRDKHQNKVLVGLAIMFILIICKYCEPSFLF